MTFRTAPARFDHAHALTEDEMHSIAPSIFATTAHPSRSDKFRPIPTISMIRHLAKEGFSVVDVQVSKARLADRAPFAKHLLRLRRLGETTGLSVGDTVPEIALKNANDGTGAYDIMAALLKIACLNGLITSISEASHCLVRHAGDVAHKVIDGTYAVLEESKKALAAPDAWSRIRLDDEEKLAFATAVHQVRWPAEPEVDGGLPMPVTAIVPAQLLDIRREEDKGSDLWSVFNRVQENVIQGGLGSTRVLEGGRLRRSRSRAIKGVDQSVSLNRALFTLANRMAEIKGVKIA